MGGIIHTCHIPTEWKVSTTKYLQYWVCSAYIDWTGELMPCLFPMLYLTQIILQIWNSPRKWLETYIWASNVNLNKDTKCNMALVLPQSHARYLRISTLSTTTIHCPIFICFYDKNKKKNEVMRSKLSTYKFYWVKWNNQFLVYLVPRWLVWPALSLLIGLFRNHGRENNG